MAVFTPPQAARGRRGKASSLRHIQTKSGKGIKSRQLDIWREIDADPLNRTPNDYTDPADRSIAEDYTKNVSFKKWKIQVSNMTEHGREAVPASQD
jgi:hypothetical protein